jgi:hypothetical protein
MNAKVAKWNAVKVFSGTTSHSRADLGERVTAWMRENKVQVVEARVLQSSDMAFHCITIVVFYQETSPWR